MVDGINSGRQSEPVLTVFHHRVAQHNHHSVSLPNSRILLLSLHERAEPQHLRYVSGPLFLRYPQAIAYLDHWLRHCCELIFTDPPSSILAWCIIDPFADEADPLSNNKDVGSQQNYIHIRIQQRNGRKTLTTLQGLPKGAYT